MFEENIWKPLTLKLYEVALIIPASKHEVAQASRLDLPCEHAFYSELSNVFGSFN